MRNFVFIIGILLCQYVHALPCPNGQGVLYKGDTIATVLKQCGEPNQKRTQEIPGDSLQEWVYYQPHQYDNGAMQISLLFNNNFIARINLFDQNLSGICNTMVTQNDGVINTLYGCGNTNTDVSMVNMCGGTFSIGDPLAVVAQNCGPPAGQQVLQSGTLERTEFIYLTQPPQTIIFQNGNLVEWK